MIGLFCYLSDDIHLLFSSCNNLNDLIGFFADNICEIYSSLKLVHELNHCQLNKCEIGLFVDSIACYLEQGGSRRSKRLLIKYLISVINLYPFGFLECVKLLKKGYVFVSPG